MKHIGKKAVISLRQPSMGPTFGIKGGAAGGGYSQVIPMELLNLHLTGDFHAVTAAHNLLSAMVDNHLHQGNELDLDLHNITWRRVLDVNDRALRNIIVGLGGKEDGVTRQTGFDITAASEVMAIFALATSLEDLRARLGRIVVGYNRAGEPVTAEQLQGRRLDGRHHARGDQAEPAADPRAHAGHRARRPVRQHRPRQLVDRRRPRSASTAATTSSPRPASAPTWAPSGSSTSSAATSGMVPDAAVLVATVRALKAHSGKFKIVAGKPLPPDLLAENPDDVRAGGGQPDQADRERQGPRRVAGRRHQRLPERLRQRARRRSARSPSRSAPASRCARTSPRAARVRPTWPQAVVEACDEPSKFQFCYPLEAPLKDEDRDDRHQDLRRRPTSSTRRPPTRSWHATRRTASATCRSASPRPTCRSRPTRR